MAELLLELLSEEIPARMQARAAADLKRLVTAALEEARLGFETAESYVTPRRLTLVVDGLPPIQRDITEERKGPRVGAPDKAIEGFLRSAGLETVEQCEVREIKGNAFYFATIAKRGEAAVAVLPGLILGAMDALSWPKSMRWGAGTRRWVRPLHQILAVFGDKVPDPSDIHVKLLLTPDSDLPNHLLFRASTVGHRFMSPGEIDVSSFGDYRTKLRAAHVMLDPAERREVIRSGASALATAEGLALEENEALLDEVAGLVEWPVPLLGRIDDAYMGLPAEVLSTVMHAYQRYFALLDGEGGLAPYFVVVANIAAEDGGAAIVAGNERVLRARLADAQFFWDQDRRNSLASRTPALKNVVFHAKLGTLDEKVDRIQALAADLGAAIPGADRDRIRSAARLAKADLITEMVGEFPELQGVMGRYYALRDGEHADVAQAIAEHYSPLGPNDSCPTAPVSVAVALADKIDTLVGFFAIGERPTGSKDPYAMRRAALGVIRLVLENGLRLRLGPVFRASGHLYGEIAADSKGEPLADGLLDFFADRLKVHLREQGVRYDLVSAVFALGGEDDLVRLLARVEALAAFIGSEDGANLLVAYNRAANIVAIEEKKDAAPYDGAPNSALFESAEERALAWALSDAVGRCGPLLEEEDFAGVMGAVAALRRPVDAFFDNVTVNCEDPALRENRLKLLSRIPATLGGVADFSKIEG
jgi:glycyl-tRNA synthetase beta chain